VETALVTPQLSSLVAALQAADGDLVNVLSGSGPFTVLAPTNEAFNAFLEANNTTLEDIDKGLLAQVLLNHVIAGNVTSSNLTTAGSGYTSTSATGPGGNNLSLYFNTSSGVEFNGVSSVVTPDISATNGTVHIVDAVIGLPTVVTHAAANPNFITLVGLLDQQGLVTTLDGTASSPFTVFAPSNDAFTAFETENPGVLASLTSDQVTSVLTYHVVAGANVLSTGIPAGPITTLETGTFTITGTTINDEADRDTNIVAFDVQGTNGVIHVISNVLLPQL
jgi:uncharacterized surface protein with fasciclin (FAS1) repeats